MEYIYDIEMFPNLFQIGFIPVALDNKLVKEYIQADINKDESLKQSILHDLGHRVFIVYKNINQSQQITIL
jgi:hypothetical protein